MQRVMSIRLVGLGLAAALLIAAGSSTAASFQAKAPGSDLEPVGGAGKIIDLVQGQETILWNALTGTVSTYELLGWPSTNGVHDLGGALMLESVDGANAGVIELGEKPMSLEFTSGG